MTDKEWETLLERTNVELVDFVKKEENKMKIWHISDTHDYHDLLKIPDGIDMVIHSGDCSNPRDPYKSKFKKYDFSDFKTIAKSFVTKFTYNGSLIGNELINGLNKYVRERKNEKK